MALTFVNVKSGERRVCKTEPMIAAHLNSSDRNPNALQGQDMGWRLAPETIVELERIKGDSATLQTIATVFKLPLENITESDILSYISGRNNKEQTGANSSNEDFNRQYQDDIRRLQDEQKRRDEVIAKERAAEGGDAPEDTDVNNNSDPTTAVDLDALTRPQLNEYAEGIGVENPSEIANKSELIKAIRNKEV